MEWTVSVAQVKTMLEATFSDVEKGIRDAVAFGLGRVKPLAASVSTSPPGNYSSATPMEMSSVVALAEDELLDMLGEWAEVASGLEDSFIPQENFQNIKTE